MKSEGLMYFTDTYLNLIALMIFFGLFLIILILQLKNYKKDKVNDAVKLPFEGDNNELG